ncbi:Holliday junction DNA helicase subunit RuvA [Antricoccus suffuscus]|uniref:Holliday junction branch migration complex subunit RuvA n=1 Tax=Antricoccus suffuscus TaxID=1629062 RepID=A0A2T0ZWH8_9ACTN|nr:Holliday junction branch migration protein RuvA [Antricoccus suffuscus]PRZ40607.1 Holliday junction DNA helicase subunit RuvA [Antricoccus suffuscus]
MIASLTGKVRSLGPQSVVLEVGGVGMLVQCAPGTLARLRIGETGALATSLVVREDSLTLYGFGDDDERVLFELLLSANGVGPKVAQAILATHPAREVRRAIATADHAVLTQVPGIGKKGAERIVIELRDKVGSLADDGSPQLQIAPAAPWRDQLHSALVGLGWSGKEADEALLLVEPEAAVAIETDGRVEVAVLLRSALRMLGRP